MTNRNPSRYTRALVLAAGIGLHPPPGGRLGLFGSLEPPHGPLVRPLAGVPPRGLVPIHPLPTPRRARRALRPGVTHRPLRMAPRAGRTGASRSRPGRPLPVAESPSRPAPPRGGVRPGGGGARASGRGRFPASCKSSNTGRLTRCENPNHRRAPSSLISSAGAWPMSDTPWSASAPRWTARSVPCPPGRAGGARRNTLRPRGKPCARCGPRATNSSSARGSGSPTAGCSSGASTSCGPGCCAGEEVPPGEDFRPQDVSPARRRPNGFHSPRGGRRDAP